MTLMKIEMDFSAALGEGLTIAVVGYVTVFSALVVLYFVFTYLARMHKSQVRSRLIRQGKQPEECCRDIFIPGDTVAAISMAIYLYNELHDEESNVITIKKVSKAYSPWSSKIYGLRNLNKW
ncbi:MAG: OadG family protein [Bacteroidales bacterium]